MVVLTAKKVLGSISVGFLQVLRFYSSGEKVPKNPREREAQVKRDSEAARYRKARAEQARQSEGRKRDDGDGFGNWAKRACGRFLRTGVREELGLMCCHGGRLVWERERVISTFHGAKMQSWSGEMTHAGWEKGKKEKGGGKIPREDLCSALWRDVVYSLNSVLPRVTEVVYGNTQSQEICWTTWVMNSEQRIKKGGKNTRT